MKQKQQTKIKIEIKIENRSNWLLNFSNLLKKEDSKHNFENYMQNKNKIEEKKTKKKKNQKQFFLGYEGYVRGSVIQYTKYEMSHSIKNYFFPLFFSISSFTFQFFFPHSIQLLAFFPNVKCLQP